MGCNKPVLIVEDDVWARLIGVVLDPTTSHERWAAFADFMSPDLPDFRGWCDKVKIAAKSLYPSDVRLVKSQDELRSNLEAAEAIVTENLKIGPEELALAPRLKVVHKYGVILRNIDVAACASRGIRVLAVRRRATISWSPQADAPTRRLTRAIRPGPIGGDSRGCGLSAEARSGSLDWVRLAVKFPCGPSHLE
jgi:glyoxylate reductase/D-3-phosphoglycerate dehydrogenase